MVSNMKKILAIVLLVATVLSFASCSTQPSTVSFVVDGEVIETYSGSAEDIKFPTPVAKDKMRFVGWFTEQGGGEQVDSENIGNYYGHKKSLTLYAVYEATEENSGSESGDTESGGEEENTETKPNGREDENVDQGGWT